MLCGGDVQAILQQQTILHAREVVFPEAPKVSDQAKVPVSPWLTPGVHPPLSHVRRRPATGRAGAVSGPLHAGRGPGGWADSVDGSETATMFVLLLLLLNASMDVHTTCG